MVIAVNTISLSKPEEYRNFIYQCFGRITKLYSEHTFILISEQPYSSSFNFDAKIIPVILKPIARKPLLLKLWYRYKISLALKKYKAGIFITADILYSRGIKIPQLSIIAELTYLQNPEVVLKNHLNYYKRNTPEFLKKVKLIATLSDFSKNNFSKNYKIEASKIDVIYNGVDEFFTPVDLTGREKIMEQYSCGNEYFLFSGTFYHELFLLNLLKAFSVFKKWQKSNMRLLIVSRSTLKTKQFTDLLRLFKYREEVKLLENIQARDLAKVTAAAYAAVCTCRLQGFNVPSLQAMKCNVPVITCNTDMMPELCGDAALYVDPANHNDVAEKLMMIFKNEKLRQELIEKGKQQVKKYSWEKTSRLLWQSILKASL